MLWNVNRTASYLGIEAHKVYYLLVMGEIEAYKIGMTWRVMSDSAKAYKTKLAV